MNTRVSFVIPVYNAVRTVSGVVEGLEQVIRSSKCSAEIILVDDGSTDGSTRLVHSLVRNGSHVRVIELSRNFGQHNALLAGIREAKGTYIICLDDDLETPPTESVKLLEAIKDSEYDVVYGQYVRSRGMRGWGSAINNAMANIVFRKPSGVHLNSFFVINRFVATHIASYDGPYVYLPGLLFQITARVGGVPINHRRGASASSRYTFHSLVRLWLNGFTNYSLLPLRISACVGLISALSGFVLAVIAIIARIIDPDISVGWTSLIVAELVMGGIVLTGIGFVGEYVGRIFITLNHRPQSIIRSMSGSRIG